MIKAGEAAGLPLCHEDCVALQQQFCYTEWAELVRARERGKGVESRGHFRLPDCSTLPRMGGTNNTCSRTGITDMRLDLSTSEFCSPLSTSSD